MRVRTGCSVCNPPQNGFVPSQDQIDATAPGGYLGYHPGRGCIEPDPCYHITSYNDMKDKPSINDVVLVGNKTSHDLGLQGLMEAISTDFIADMFAKYNP